MRRLLLPGLLLFCTLLGAGLIVPWRARLLYGLPSPRLSPLQRWLYSARLLWHDGLLTDPLSDSSLSIPFVISPGESIASIAARLEEHGLIRSATAFRDYLVYRGLDTTLRAGRYHLSASESAIEIAHAFQSPEPSQAILVIWPGWRLEEIAAALPASGLILNPDEFLAQAKQPGGSWPDLSFAASIEGFFFPDTYTLDRTTPADRLIALALENFTRHLTPEIRRGFEQQGLTLYQAVTLASIVERETVHAEEAPLIAAVYLNRLRLGMPLQADPTVQYALGWDGKSWWKAPLTPADLQIASPYNTYLHPGLPPGPIANPGLNALQAVANPASTEALFFRRRCDESGYHVFTRTYEEHLRNDCTDRR
uniref:Endolytic murein transglycosylase n=1 Tax=uncultured Chloroflexota bacterium TaxID=166587 RepID=H5SIE0_9CHLR|nr:aminodeoxychorismate lyase [uncultured Chloroflexota bacterium]